MYEFVYFYEIVEIKIKTTLEIPKDGLTLNSHPFYLASGDMHYFDILKVVGGAGCN